MFGFTCGKEPDDDEDTWAPFIEEPYEPWPGGGAGPPHQDPPADRWGVVIIDAPPKDGDIIIDDDGIPDYDDDE